MKNYFRLTPSFEEENFHALESDFDDDNVVTYKTTDISNPFFDDSPIAINLDDIEPYLKDF